MTRGASKKYSSRLTAPGISLLIFSILGIGIGRILGIFEIFILGVCIFPLLLFIPRFNKYLKRIEVKCEVLPDRVACHEKAKIRIQFFPDKPNKKLRGTSIKIENIISAEESSFQDTIPDIRYSLNSAKNSLESEIHTYKRGPLNIGPLRIEHTDPFGFINSSKQTDAECQLIVHPHYWKIDPPVCYSGLLPEKETSYVGTGNEFHSIRKYEPGNDLRLIHWPSTARQGSLMIRQNTTMSSETNLINIFLDNRAITPPAQFENMVSAAASIAVACKSRGDDVQILTATNEIEISAGMNSNSDMLLDFLSFLKQDWQENSDLQGNAIDYIIHPNSKVCIALLGRLSSEDERQIINALTARRSPNGYEDSKSCFIFFENQIPLNFPSLHIDSENSFTDVWQPDLLYDPKTN